MKFKRIIAAVLTVATLITAIMAITLSSFAATDAAMPTATNGETVDVWLIAGQSNAVGYGEVANYPTDSQYAEDKTLLTNGSDNVWFYGKDESQGNFSPDFVSGAFGRGQTGSRSGAEIGLTTALNGNGKMNAVIKLAYGSSYIYPNTSADISINRGTWTPPSYIEKHGISTVGNKVGDLYYNFLQTVDEGLKLLIAKGYTPVIRGMWWMQGEAETFRADTSGAYQELLTTFIKDVRRDLSEISGTVCSEMPFVYGRLYRKAGNDPNNSGKTYRQATPYLTAVQAGQDAVAKDTSLKNVFMVTMALTDSSDDYDVGDAVDLLDPASGNPALPSQQDGWHYDAFTQQMIGEAFVRKVSLVAGDVTPYGIVPSTETAPFAVFYKDGDSYVFDKCYELRYALERAKNLTLASLAQPCEEVVVYLRRDATTTDYARNMSDSGSLITVDLGGHTLTCSGNGTLLNAGVDDCLYSDKARTATFNFKNGKILAYSYALIYGATNGSTYTKEKTLVLNFENVELGFAAGSTAINLLNVDHSNHASTKVDINYEFNYKNCVIDAKTNRPSQFKGIAVCNLSFAPDTANAYGYSDYTFTFEGCTFTVNTISDFNFNLSSEGDVIRFKKDNNGSFGKVLSGNTAACADIYTGIDDGVSVRLGVTNSGATSGGYNVYNIALANGESLPTAYAPIPKNYADAAKYPLALFKKTASGYEFSQGYNDWKQVMEAAVTLAHATSGTTEEAVILLRRDAVYSSYPQHITNLGHTITVDLNGYELTLRTSMFNTQTADYAEGLTPETVKCGTINVKNGKLLTRDFGLAYTRTNDSGKAYTVEKTLYMNFDNVYIGFSPEASTKKVNLLTHAYRCDLNVNENFVFTYKNCTLDLATNTTSDARLGTAQTTGKEFGDTSSLSNADFKLYFEGCKFICYSPDQIAFKTQSTSGDSFTFIKDKYGDYSSVYLTVDNPEPDSTYLYNDSEGGQVSYLATDTVEGIYRKYELVSSHVKTKYGSIPRADFHNVVAVFTRSGDGYKFYKSYASYKAAFEAATVLTDGTSDAYGEAVLLMLRDYTETGIPYCATDICSTVTLDLDGYTLTVKGSFFNSWLRKSNGNVANINVKNGTLLTGKYGFIYTAPADNDTSYSSEKTFNVNFDNVYVGFSNDLASGFINLLATTYNCSTTTNAKFNLTLTNSTVDLYNNVTSASRLGVVQTSASGTTALSNVDFDMRFVNCTILAHDPDQLSYSKKSAEGDSITFVKGTDGSYPRVLIPHDDTYQNSFSGLDGSTVKTLYLSATGKTELSLYEYSFTTTANASLATDYGVITSTYADRAAYPFALFYKDGNSYVFSRGYDSYESAMEAAVNLTKPSASSVKSEVVLLLRRDFTAETFPNGTGSISTLVTVDLNGYTLGAHGSLGNTQTQDNQDSSGAIVKTNGVITYKNGKMTAKVHPLLYAAKAGTYTAGYEKTLTMNFNNLELSFGTAYTSLALFARVASEHTTARMTHYMNFNNCVIDLSTNKSTNANYYAANLVYGGTDYTDIHLSFMGCSFKAATANDLSFKLGSGDSVTLGKAEDGSYTSFALPSGSAAPSNAYNAQGLTFVKVADDGRTAIYRLTPTAAASIDFTPKTSITLDSSLTFNIYIPDAEELVSASLDGVNIDLDSLVLKDGYYLYSVPLDAGVAAKEMKFAVTLSHGGTTLRGTFTMSIPRYAKKLLGADSANAEKTLVKDVLAYIRSAYQYFGTENSAEAVAELNGLLGSYRGYFENVSDAYSLGTALRGATFVLTATPAIRLYLPEGAELNRYSFKIGDATLPYTSSIETASGPYLGLTYVDISLLAYRMTDTVEYYVDGNLEGSYNIGAYYDFITSSQYTANDKTELCDLVEKFIIYSKSARAYRNSLS